MVLPRKHKIYLHESRRREELGLTALESFDARLLASHHGVSASVSLFAMLFALLGLPELAFLSPSSFALMGPGHRWYGKRSARRRDAFVARMGGDTVGVS